MARSKTVNMTQGDPLPLLLTFALPMLVGNIYQQAYSLADSAIVGRLLGADALAAVGATGSVSFLFFSVCNGIASGGGIVTSQYFGAGDPHQVKKAIANSAYIMFVSSFIMAVIAYIAANGVLNLMGTPKEIMPDALIYMRMTCIGVPLVAVYNYSSSMLRALGDSRTPLYFLIFSCVLNVALDYFCVKTLNMGVFGAAFATVVAQVIAGVGCLLFALKTNPYFRLTRKDMAYDKTIVYKSVRLGIPLAMQWSMIAISSTALQTFVNSYGTVAVAAFTATNRVEQLVHQPYGSLSAALSTFSGQNFGAGRTDRLKLGLKKGMLMSAIFSVFMFVVFQIAADPIMKLFVEDTQVISLGAQAMRLTSWLYIFLAMIYMTRGILNGVGDALFAFINGFVEMLCRIFIPMMLAMIPFIGIWGIWWTAGITWMISALFCWLRYIYWRKKNLVNE